MDKLAEGKRVFDVEIEALRRTRDSINENFVQILDLIVNCTGKVIITGIGKPGHIGRKMAATFASLGTSSFYLHPGEAMHGDLGMVDPNDIVIAISYSGESDEIIKILPNIKLIGAVLVGITGNKQSTLAQNADVVQVLPSFEEACYLGMAPTSSTTALLCYGDALAVVASGIYGFKDADFGKYHPAGTLGKKILLKVDDLMAVDSDNAVVYDTSTLKDAIVELSKKGLGIVSVVDKEKNLVGVITDGDIRRQLEKGVNVYDLYVHEVMNSSPIAMQKGKMAIEALNIFKEKNVSCMPILEGNKVIGTIKMQSIISAGIVG